MKSLRLLLLSCVYVAFVDSALAQAKNVLFVVVDDLKPVVGAYGQTQMVTPHMDALAASGTTFLNAHAQQAICGPSRISFLTGKRPDATKVYDLSTFMRDVTPNTITLPEHFKANGYETVGMGKFFHMARKNDPQSWTLPFIEDKKLPYTAGFQKPVMKHYQSEEVRKTVSELSEEAEHLEREDMQKEGLFPSFEALDIPDDAYPDGAMAVKSIELMKGFAETDKPFFLAVGFHRPHLPFVAPKKYWDLYDRTKIQVAEHQGRAEGAPSMAYHKSGELQNYTDIPRNLDIDHRLPKEKQQELIHGYYASVSYVDAQIGKIIAYMKESGLWENTIIVLLGDHGWHLGDHGLWNKHTNFEQATRTVLIIRSPDLPESVSNTSPVELIDIFPTVSQLAALSVPQEVQGKSLLPILTKKSTRIREVAMSQYPRDAFMGYTVRSDRYRYTEWVKKSAVEKSAKFPQKSSPDLELYDYSIDPLETRNLINDPKYAEIAKDLRAQLVKVYESSK